MSYNNRHYNRGGHSNQQNKAAEATQKHDYSFPQAPNDGISELSINGTRERPTSLCVAGSWDGTLSVYEVRSQQGQMNVMKQAEQKAEGPILCTGIADDGYNTVFGGCDRKLRMYDVRNAGATAQVIGTHDAAIKCVNVVPGRNVFITGGWDKTVKVWDARSPQPVTGTTLGERVYAMDANQTKLVVGTADKKCHVFDISQGNLREVASFEVLKYQTRSISMFADGNGFAIGSIEGRVGIEYFDEMDKKNNNNKGNTKNFIFKCHREKINNNNAASRIFAVNSIFFHPNYNTLCTGGSDGVFCMWDKDARQRLGMYQDFKYSSYNQNNYHNPITSLKISPSDNCLFYSMSYDWSMGANPTYPSGGGMNSQNRIMVHRFDDSEVKPKPN